MKLKCLFVFSLCFWAGVIHTQEWVFEYESMRSSSCYSSWKNKMNQNTIHEIGISPNAGKEFRTRFIELNQEGKLISFFKAKECNRNAKYYNYGQDSIISFSETCNEQWVKKLSLFSSSGKKLMTKEFENKFSSDLIIGTNEGVSILRKDYQYYGDKFHLAEFSMNGEIKEFSYNYSDLLEDDLKVSIRGCIKIKSSEYIMSAQLHEINNSAVIHHYVILFYVKHGKIIWVKSFKGKIQTIQMTVQTINGYLLKGEDYEGEHIVILVDLNGNELNSFKPQFNHHGIGPFFHFHNNRLYSIDTEIHRTTIILNEYDMTSGKLIWNKSIPTDYWRISNLNIGFIENNHIILTGGFLRSSTSTESKAFVMKTVINHPLDEKRIEPRVITMSVDDLVEEISEEVLSVKIYPNPTQFRITFDVNVGKESDIRLLKIFSINGNVIKSIEFTENQIETDISMLQTGTYKYSVFSHNKANIIKGKFVVQ